MHIIATEGVDFARHFAAIEVIAHGVNSGLAGGACGESFLFRRGHGAKGAREVRLTEDLAGLGRFTVRNEMRHGTRPQREEFAAALD